jgi:hypothetical protein
MAKMRCCVAKMRKYPKDGKRNNSYRQEGRICEGRKKGFMKVGKKDW